MSNLVVAGIQSQQVFDCAQRFQVRQVIAGNIDVLQVLILLNSIHGGKIGLLHTNRKESMSCIVEGFTYLIETIL